jgi:hypothetical protein
VGEQLLQIGSATRHMGFHRAKRQIQRLGRIAVAMPLLQTQLDGLALRTADTAQGNLQIAA